MKRNYYSAPSSNLTQQTFSGFSWMIAGSGIQVVLKIVVLAVLARLVSPYEFGVMGIAVLVMELSKMFAHMGVGPALVQRKELEPRHLATGFSLSLALGTFFAFLLMLTAPLLADFFRMIELTRVLRVTALIFLIDSFTLLGQALMQRNMKFRTTAGMEVISYTLGYGAVGIILAYMGWGVWALVVASLSQSLLFTAILVIVQPFPKQLGFDRTTFNELIFFGGGMTLAKFWNYLANHGDNLVVGRTLGAAALGIYGRAHQFMVMPAGLFGNALDRALFPAMAKVQDDQLRLARAYLTGVGILALAAIPISLLFVLSAHEIVMVVLGPAWLNVVLPLQILACSLLFRMSYKMSDSLARAVGAVYRRAWRQGVYAFLIFTGSYVGHFWGLAGVATGVAVALVINFLMMAHLSLQITGISWSDFVKVHRHGIILGIITGVVCYSLLTLCRVNQLPDSFTLLIIGLGSGIPLLLTLLYFPRLIISDELKDLFEMLVLRRIKKLYAKNA